MKSMLLALSILAAVLNSQAHAQGGTLSANAAGFTLSPLFPFAMTSALTSALTTEAQQNKEALEILNQGQEYFQTGEMGILIASKVETLQEEQDMSDDEAIDLLMVKASEVLK